MKVTVIDALEAGARMSGLVDFALASGLPTAMDVDTLNDAIDGVDESWLDPRVMRHLIGLDSDNNTIGAFVAWPSSCDIFMGGDEYRASFEVDHDGGPGIDLGFDTGDGYWPMGLGEFSWPWIVEEER